MYGRMTVVVVLTQCSAVLTSTTKKTDRQPAVRQSVRSMSTTIRRAAVRTVIDRRRLQGLPACRTARQRSAHCRQWFVIRCRPALLVQPPLPPLHCHGLASVRSPTVDIARAPTPTRTIRWRYTSSTTTTARFLSAGNLIPLTT